MINHCCTTLTHSPSLLLHLDQIKKEKKWQPNPADIKHRADPTALIEHSLMAMAHTGHAPATSLPT